MFNPIRVAKNILIMDVDGIAKDYLKDVKYSITSVS